MAVTVAAIFPHDSNVGPMPMPSETHFRWSKVAVRLMAFVMLGIAGLGAILLFQDAIAARIGGAVWIAIFAAIAWYAWRRALQPDPVVTVSARGLFDRRLMDDPLPWNVIARIEGLEVETVTFVGLNFHDWRSALAAAKPIVRFMAPVHLLLGLPAVSISMTLLDGSDADLVAAIALRRPELAPTLQA